MRDRTSRTRKPTVRHGQYVLYENLRKAKKVKRKTLKRMQIDVKTNPIRGRPHGKKDAKPRKIRQDFIDRLMHRHENAKQVKDEVKRLEQIAEKRFINCKKFKESSTVTTSSTSSTKNKVCEIKQQGRPVGKRDTKPRRIRQDFIDRLIAKKEDVSSILRLNQKIDTMRITGANEIQDTTDTETEEEEILSESEVLNSAPRSYTEQLHSLILGEINTRIVSQSFQNSLFCHSFG